MTPRGRELYLDIGLIGPMEYVLLLESTSSGNLQNYCGGSKQQKGKIDV